MSKAEIFVPGRIELGGNHTDHQGGCVLAAAVSLGITAVAEPNGTDMVNIKSKEYGDFSVDIGDTDVRQDEAGTPAAIIRGICDSFLQSGNVFGGFDADVESEIPCGSGLASSAAFEVLAARIIATLFFGESVPLLFIAQAAQRAENEYFKKPCGLMDQLTCTFGGTIFADFKDPNQPLVQCVDFDFSKCGYALCVINSGAGHEGLTADYAQIPRDMCLIAAALGHSILSEATAAEFYSVFPLLRQKYGDRPVFRALHYFEETRRAEEQAKALSDGNFNDFLKLYLESAESTEKYLQNIVSENEPEHRLEKVIAAAKEILGTAGAVRINGGGFAGTAQAFVPLDAKEYFKREMSDRGFYCLWPEII